MVVTPSYGNDDAGANAVQTEAWWLLSPREKGFMRQLAGPAPDDAGAKRVFETGAHRWVFIHELGHCWQACTGAKAHRTRYQLEYDANRIAAAYWHERDPEIVQYLQRIFRSVAASPSPVPAGQTAADYFNENYDQLGNRQHHQN